MKVLILAGGRGTRIQEETEFRPKPMVEIGGKPILWHIMKHYSHHGFNEFVILLGYKGYVIKEFFANYFLHNSDITIDMTTNQIEVHNNTSEPWKVTLLNTGLDANTGLRILRARPFVKDETFMLTYGDGVSNVDLNALLQFHRSHGKSVTLTAVQPEGRYGSVDIHEEGKIEHFLEKPKGDGAWINGGFFVCSPSVFDYLDQPNPPGFEREPLEKMSENGALYAYRHRGFWKCMDTTRDKDLLNEMWESGRAGWKLWT